MLMDPRAGPWLHKCMHAANHLHAANHFTNTITVKRAKIEIRLGGKVRRDCSAACHGSKPLAVLDMRAAPRRPGNFFGRALLRRALTPILRVSAISEPLIAWTIPARDPKFSVKSVASPLRCEPKTVLKIGPKHGRCPLDPPSSCGSRSCACR